MCNATWSALKGNCKWIIDSGKSKHMTSHMTTFDIQEVLAPCNVYLGVDSIIEAIGMGSILIEVMVEGKI